MNGTLCALLPTPVHVGGPFLSESKVNAMIKDANALYCQKLGWGAKGVPTYPSDQAICLKIFVKKIMGSVAPHSICYTFYLNAS